jgi:ankyrin repeat protein
MILILLEVLCVIFLYGTYFMYLINKNKGGQAIITITPTNGKTKIKTKDRTKIAEFHRAIISGNNQEVKMYLDLGMAKPDDRCHFGRPALHNAAAQSNIEVLKVLVEKGCLINSLDKFGQTALYYVVLSDMDEKYKCANIEYLLDSGADIDIDIPVVGGSVLHAAVIVGDLSIVKLLVKRSIDLDKTGDKTGAKTKTKLDSRGNTALDIAISLGRSDIIEYLQKV